MLVNFRVKNFKSFKNNTEFSMEATKLKNLKESNTFEVNNIALLKSAVIYGANASGKSNLLDAMNKMKTILISSHSMQKMQTYTHEPFLLNTEFEEKSTLYEIELIINDEMYRYGFEIDKKSIILEEWLYRKKLITRAKETKLFTRVQENITIGANFKEGKKLETKTRADALFLSIVAQFNGDIALNILDWFSLDFQILSSLKSDEFKFSSFETIKDNNYKKDIIKLLKSADVGIYDLDTKKISVEEFLEIHANNKELNGEFLKKIIEEASGEKIDNDDAQKIQTSHMQYDKNNEFKEFKYFDLSFESDGTQRLLALSAPLILVLKKGGVLVIDELDHSMHTDLVKAIIELFNSKEMNPNNAQLIFTTHDTNLLSQELFRRDQIWFTEKDIYGASKLYSLVEYGKGKARDDLVLEKNYLEGKFGAKPHINSLAFEVSIDGE